MFKVGPQSNKPKTMLDDWKIVNFFKNIYVMPLYCHVDKKRSCKMIYECWKIQKIKK
jgi:hypothetical protein